MGPIRAEIYDGHIVEQGRYDTVGVTIRTVTGLREAQLTPDEARALGLALLVMGSTESPGVIGEPLFREQRIPRLLEAIKRAERDGIPEQIKWTLEEE